jgi:hypothetical protein
VTFRRGAAFLALLSLLLLLAAGLGYLAGRRTESSRVDSAPVVQAVRKVARLATVEMEVADVVRYEDVRKILVFDIPKNAVLRVRGRVLGGFDLERGFSVDVDAAARHLRVRMPAPGIMAVDERVEWFSETSGWLNPITPDDRTRWGTWARGALGRAARDAGLFGRAETHARELFSAAAAAFGWSAETTFASGIAPPSP